jgi:two-component system LytT family response regulator
MTIRSLVVDDEPLARQRLKRLLAAHSDVEVVGEAEDGEAAVRTVLELQPDLVFLDVQMPNATGIEALEQLREKLPDSVRPLVVFTTAFEEHAVQAFALEGTDYLIKPIDKEQLTRALRRAREALWHRRGAVRDDDEADEAAEATPKKKTATAHLAAHRAGKIVNLALEDVGCVAVEDTITWAHTPQGKYRLKAALHEVEERLPSPPFVRVSRSTIVNLEWIDHLSPMFSGTYVASLRGAIGLEVQVSRRRARRLRELLGW